MFPAQRDGKTYLIEPDAIEIIRTEGRELALYDRQKRRFLLNRPLYELEKQLGKISCAFPSRRLSASAGSAM